MPNIRKYTHYLRELWKSRYLTNNGIYVQELEERLKKYWKVKNVVCVTSGTLATEIALKAMGITKKIYLSPYSYVSTVSVPLWMGIKPVFIDLYKKVKSPYLSTHVYGLPNLYDIHPILYDASHAFCTKVEGESIMKYGDCSVISFHATKIFQSVEGGAIVTQNDELAEKCRWMRNFGHNGEYEYHGVGINGKMSEFHAAMGLCSLDTIDETKRKYDYIIYRYNMGLGYSLKDVSYYPVFYPSENDVLRAMRIFNKNTIFPRRYFYPSLNTVFGDISCPAAEELSKTVLCLPLYFELTDKDIDRIIRITKETL